MAGLFSFKLWVMSKCRMEEADCSMQDTQVDRLSHVFVTFLIASLSL